VWTTGLVVAALLAGCSNGTVSAKGTATLAQATTTTDPWAVPAVIDVAYLQRVMDRLDQSLGDALRELVAAKAVDTKVETIFQAIYGQPEFNRTNSDFAGIAQHDLDKYRSVPGNPLTTVGRILSSAGSCTFFTATRTLAPALVSAPPEADTHAFLALRRPNVPPDDLANPTGQVLVLDALTRSGATPKDPCS
jgi:hypothetical protein